MATREKLTDGLREQGFSVLPSLANFVFATHPQKGAGELMAALRERRILVRRFNRPRIDNYLRITVGTDEQTALLLSALREIRAS